MERNQDYSLEISAKEKTQEQLQEESLEQQEQTQQEEGKEQETLEQSMKRKRPPMDKNTAFMQYKEEEEGRKIENEIVKSRAQIKDLRGEIKTFTDVV